MPTRLSTEEIVRASELGQYAYCARAWWLARVQGIPPANISQLQAGLAHHRAHGRRVLTSRRLRWLAVGLLVLAAATLGAFLILSLGH